MQSKGRKRLAATFLASCLAVGGLWLYYGATPAAEFVTIGGERITLRDLAGSPVLVNFWASNCHNCLEELPALSRLYQRYAGRGLKVIGVAMAYDMPSNVRAVAERLKIAYPVVFDHQGKHARAFSGVELVPYSVLLAPDGHVVMRKLGLLDMDALQVLIENMLTES